MTQLVAMLLVSALSLALPIGCTGPGHLGQGAPSATWQSNDDGGGGGGGGSGGGY